MVGRGHPSHVLIDDELSLVVLGGLMETFAGGLWRLVREGLLEILEEKEENVTQTKTREN